MLHRNCELDEEGDKDAQYPTIQEALCEIHFRLPEGESWHPALFSRFFRHIQAEFPDMEPVTEAAFHLQLQSGRAEFVPPRSRMRYKHAARQLLIQLADGILTVNMLPQYAGWRQLQAMARKTVDNRVDIDYHMSCNRLPAQFPLRYLA